MTLSTPQLLAAITQSSGALAEAADLLLWIYQRADLPAGDPAVVAAFRRLSSTD